MCNPKISIIVPVYKVEKYLKRCVDSILAQTYTNFELILVDDGSPDTCPAMCDKFAKQDNRIKVIHKENGGLSDARNAGLSIATGEYIGFVDSDDYIDPQMYDILLHCLLEDNADVAICNYIRVNESYQKITTMLQPSRNKCFSQEEFIQELLQPYGGYFVVAWNKLYRKAIFNDLRFPLGKQHEDEFIIHHVVARCKKITCVENVLYYYFQREGSIMSQEFNVRHMDYGEALIDRYHFTKKNKYHLWKDYCACRLSYELEKWSAHTSDIDIQKKYNELRKKSKFLVFEKAAWKDYSIRGKIYMKMQLIMPGVAKNIRTKLHVLKSPFGKGLL